jgi:predicted nucleic acid-binding protein
VLQEFYVVATRKFEPPLTRRRSREIVAAYAQWPLVQIDAALILAASELEERPTLSFWDALIIESARRAGAKRLLSANLQAGRRLGGLKIENPFASVAS